MNRGDLERSKPNQLNHQDARTAKKFNIETRMRSQEPEDYPRRTVVVMARSFFVIAGGVLIGVAGYAWWFPSAAISILSVVMAGLGIVALAFGLFAPAQMCANFSYRFLSLLGL